MLKLKVQVMSFFHMCMEKFENSIILLLQKNSPSPANKFLVHAVGATGKLIKL